MKSAIILLLSACMANLCASREITREPCILYSCATDVYEPVCVKQWIDGCWKQIIFQNECFMLSAKSCGKAHFKPCVENKCKNPSAGFH